MSEHNPANLSAYLRPTGPIAADVLLASDPAACMALAQLVIVRPLMANHSYGLWGYSGETESGRPLTVQSIGIGGASAAVVLGELAAHGARRAIHLAARDPGGGAEPGDRIVVTLARALDGTSRALGSPALARPDAALTARVLEAAGSGAREGVISSIDPGAAAPSAPELNGTVSAVDFETAALFAAGQSHGVAMAAAFVAAPPPAGDGDLAPGLAELAVASIDAFEDGATRPPATTAGG